MVQEKLPVNIVIICGSPIKEGNVETLLRVALKEIKDLPDVETELILLAEWWKSFRGCNHCNFCTTKQEPRRFCMIDDQMTEVYPKLLKADAIVFASPTYATRITGLLTCFMDRMRPLYVGRIYNGSLKYKVGAALAVSFGRQSGNETTLLSIIQSLLLWGMIPSSNNLKGPYGAVALSSYGGEGKIDPNDRHAVLKDKYGVKRTKQLFSEVVGLTKIIKKGTDAFNIENQYLQIYKKGAQ